MSKQVISETAHINEFERIIERLSFVIETENDAIENGHIHVLESLQEEKTNLSYIFQKKWKMYSPKLKRGESKRIEAFGGLVERIEALGELMRRNQILLTAAKVNTANRIEAGMMAWRRHHNEKATSYGVDGRADPYKTGPNATTSRLI